MTEAAKEPEAAQKPAPGRKILVAEHAPIAPDLLKLFLSQRGHQSMPH